MLNRMNPYVAPEVIISLHKQLQILIHAFQVPAYLNKFVKRRHGSGVLLEALE